MPGMLTIPAVNKTVPATSMQLGGYVYLAFLPLLVGFSGAAGLRGRPWRASLMRPITSGG